jgi:hypothetical protein
VHFCALIPKNEQLIAGRLYSLFRVVSHLFFVRFMAERESALGAFRCVLFRSLYLKILNKYAGYLAC